MLHTAALYSGGLGKGPSHPSVRPAVGENESLWKGCNVIDYIRAGWVSLPGMKLSSRHGRLTGYVLKLKKTRTDV